MFLKDFSPNFVHIAGSDNILADGLSQSPILEGQEDTHSMEALAFLPPEDPDQPQFPLDIDLIAHHQQQD